ELSQRQADGEGALRKGQAAQAAGDLQGAKLYFADAVEKLAGEEPSLAGLRGEAQRQRDETQRLLDQLASRAQARARYEEFRKRRDEALFHEAPFTGLTPSASITATRTAARRALELFAAPPGPEDGPSNREPAVVTAGCYELLLILARAVA